MFDDANISLLVTDLTRVHWFALALVYVILRFTTVVNDNKFTLRYVIYDIVTLIGKPL